MFSRLGQGLRVRVRSTEAGQRGRRVAKMAAAPGVTMHSGSPARELTLAVQQGGNQTHGDRVKPEDVTGRITSRAAAL